MAHVHQKIKEYIRTVTTTAAVTWSSIDLPFFTQITGVVLVDLTTNAGKVTHSHTNSMEYIKVRIFVYILKNIVAETSLLIILTCNF